MSAKARGFPSNYVVTELDSTVTTYTFVLELGAAGLSPAGD